MGIFTKALKPLTGPGIFWPQDYPELNGTSRGLTGINVTAENAFSMPAFYAGVRAIAEDIAKLPFIVYEELAPRGRRRAKEHALWRVLHDVANPEMTAFSWREVSMGHLLTWGNAYSEIVRDAQGNVRELWPLPPHRVTVKRDDNGEKFFRVTLALPRPDGKMQIDLDRRDVFHVPGLGYDGYVGYDPITMLAKAIGLGLAAQEHGERFWANNARPGGALVVPEGLMLSEKREGKLRGQWTAGHQGLGNAQRIAILKDGITFQEIGIDPQAGQYIETRKFQTLEIARGLRIQPHKIGDLDRATFSNIEHQDLEYTRDSLGGWAARIEAQARKDLFVEGEPFYGEMLFDALLRADSLTRARVWSIYRLNGNVTANYVNERENFPLRDDPGGDEYLLPVNVTTEGGPASDAQGEDVIKTTITAVPDDRTVTNGRHPTEVTA